MFYVLSKVFFIVARPSAVVSLLIAGGALLLVIRRTERLGRRSVIVGAVLLIVCGLTPLGKIVTQPLEDRFRREALPSDIAGIILLGGYEDAVISKGRSGLAVNDRAERLTETIDLSRRYPSARIIVTGGAGTVLGEAPDEAAEVVARYLGSIGIASERIVIEGRSLTTYENALFTRALVAPSQAAPYLLVTSAIHMPRAMGVFRRQGYNVFAWPVDYRTAGSIDRMTWNDNFPDGLRLVDYAFKEWVGLLAYWLTDRTDALLPGPHAK